MYQKTRVEPWYFELLCNARLFEPDMLLDARMEKTQAELFLKVHLVPLGLDADLRYSLIFRHHVDPRAVSFFGHEVFLLGMDKC